MKTIADYCKEHEALEKELEQAVLAGEETKEEATRQQMKELVKEVEARGEAFCTVLRCYMDAIENRRPYVDFSDNYKASEVADIVKVMADNGVMRFTLSSSWSNAMETAFLFQQQGCIILGMIHTVKRYETFTQRKVLAPAMLFTVAGTLGTV